MRGKTWTKYFVPCLCVKTFFLLRVSCSDHGKQESNEYPQSHSCLRPYHVEDTGSRPIPAVKQRRVKSVLGRETTWEHSMLQTSFCSLPPKLLLTLLCTHKVSLILPPSRLLFGPRETFLFVVLIHIIYPSPGTGSKPWNRNGQNIHICTLVCDHITLNTPGLVRSPQLSNVELSQYLGGRP